MADIITPAGFAIRTDEGLQRFQAGDTVPADIAARVAWLADPEPEPEPTGPVDPGNHTKAELLEIAADKGIEVPAGATKAEIADLLAWG